MCKFISNKEYFGSSAAVEENELRKMGESHGKYFD